VDNVEGAGYLEPVAFSPGGERILVQKVDADGTPNLTSVASDGIDGHRGRSRRRYVGAVLSRRG
jgi:hypothetical protein